MGTTNLSGNDSYELDVDAAVQSQNQAGNYSTIYWRRWVRKTWGSGYYGGANPVNNIKIWRSTGQVLGESSGFSYDFTGGVPKDALVSSGTYQLNHDANGFATFEVIGTVNLATLGSARATSGVKTALRIPKTPSAPSANGIDQVTPRSMRYRFTGNSSNGLDLLEYQVGYGTNATTPQSFMSTGKGGVANLVNLNPSTVYYVWSRGRNSLGWGPWSARKDARTLAGARLRVGGVWKDVIPLVKSDGVWKNADVLVRSGGKWKGMA